LVPGLKWRNRLEQIDDPNGTWRAYANRALGEEYQELFERLDMLVLLAAPGFEAVKIGASSRNTCFAPGRAKG
jgi:D-glycerate 3-kinase